MQTVLARGIGMSLILALTLALAFAMFLCVAQAPVQAQDYPTRPVTVVIPFTAGGPADTAARTISEALRYHLGQALIPKTAPRRAASPAPRRWRWASRTVTRCCSAASLRWC